MSWAFHSSCRKGLRLLCRKKLMDEVFSPMQEKNQWKILILDDLATKILSSCFKTEDVLACNIAVIENLDNAREELPYMSAIYILFPSVLNIGFLQADFASPNYKYKEAHLFFLSDVPGDVLKELATNAAQGVVQTFKEIDLLFLPIDSQAFSLSDDDFFSDYYDAFKELEMKHVQFLAQKVATLCVALNTKPKIRYRRQYIKNLILAEEIQTQLQNYEEELSCATEGELLILDRGFDCISPIIHEFTLQAMAYDLLSIRGDVFEYTIGEPEEEAKTLECSLSEEDALWCKLRHEHIADVAKIMDRMYQTKKLLKTHADASKFRRLPELGEIVRNHLLLRIDQSYISFKHMASECMKKYCSGVNVLAETEQNLALGIFSKEFTVEEAMPSVEQILSNEAFSPDEKLRVLLLLIFFKKGITKQEFDDLVTRSGIPFNEAAIITNVLHLDIDVFRPGFCRAVDFKPERQFKEEALGYKHSRWVPLMKSVILNSIRGCLDNENYPYLKSKEMNLVVKSESRRRSSQMSHLIVLVAGGVTYSEIRCAYEVMDQYKGWEVFVGGDCTLTPTTFLENLGKLRRFISKDM